MIAHAGSYMGFFEASQRVLATYGDYPVESVRLYRTPLSAPIAFMLGRYSPDTFYHLAMVCRVHDRDVIVEKTAFPRVSLSYEVSSNTEVFDVFSNRQGCTGNDTHTSFVASVMRKRVLSGTFTINEMLGTTRQRMGDYAFFSYDAFTNNCQDFVRNCLLSVGCLSKAIDGWLYQGEGLASLRRRVPSFVKSAVRGFTDMRNFLGRITRGRASAKRQRRRR